MKNNTILKIIAKLSHQVTSYNVNSACMFMVHQPKLPIGSKKLRKF